MSAALRVLIVGEGRSDIGDLDALRAPQGRRERRPTEGFVPPIVRRLVGGKIELEAQKIANLGRSDGMRRPPGHGDRAARALALAAAGDFDLLVYVKDVDKEGGRKKSNVERRQTLRNMHDEIDAGFAAVAHAANVTRVKATPCRMIEAWALGDPVAIARVLRTKRASVKVPSRPEELWGDERDPESNHPKCVLRRVLDRPPDAETLEEIALEANIATLRTSCPESFEPFADAMTATKRQRRRSR